MLYRSLPILLLGACGWPNYANLPQADVVDAADNPAATVSDAIAWTLVDDENDTLAVNGTDNGDPRDVRPVLLDSMMGVQVKGSLRGVGWNAAFEPIEYDNGDGCTGTLSTGRDGDWAGDLDFTVVEIDAAANNPVLCARVVQPNADLGWELVLYPLNECGLPAAPVQDGDDVLGLDLGRQADGWKAPVQPGKSYGVLLAGYDPGPGDDAELDSFAYAVGVSVIIGADGREICPALPTEVGQ